MRWLDVSMPITSGMAVWAGDPPPRAHLCCSIAAGDGCDVTALELTTHTGTHIDAPAHFITGAASIESMPLELMRGPALVVQVDDPVSIRPEHLPECLKRGDRVLFRTRNSACTVSAADFVFLAPAAARRLVEAGVALVGVDGLSVDGPGDSASEAHLALLGAGIWIVEGLRLAAAPTGACEFACLPLLIPGADGAPARALVGLR